MSVPKRRQTSSRRDRRRHHNDKVSVSHTVVCSECGARRLPHTMCEACGMYRGKKIRSSKE
jgi:large subunit ribosomal protein L32